MIVPVYQSEISPAENRGKLACIEFTGNIAGYASSVVSAFRFPQRQISPIEQNSRRRNQWIDYFSSFITSDLSWRIPLFVQVVIGLILAGGTLLIPESPRWLLDQDMDEEGMRILADLHGDGNPEDPKAREEFREIKEGVLADVRLSVCILEGFGLTSRLQRLAGDRSYRSMWRRYKYRVIIAMSAQGFAQLVRFSRLQNLEEDLPSISERH